MSKVTKVKLFFKRLIIWGVIGSVAFGVFLNLVLLFHFISFDGVHGAIFRHGFGDDAVYAPGYSWHGFWRISEGDDVSRVLDILGEPMSRTPYETVYFNALGGGLISARNYGEDEYRRVSYIPEDEGMTWRYTVPDPKGSYTLRNIYFDASGRVTGKEAMFYID